MCLVNCLMVSSVTMSGSLPDIVTFKSQVTSDCETDSQVLDWVPWRHYLRLAISNLKNTEIKRALSFVVVACYFCFAHVNLTTCPLAVTVTQAKRTFISCTFVVMSVESRAKHRVLVTTSPCDRLPPLKSSHRSIAFTTTPPNMGERGQPCLRPRCSGILADFSPSAWITRMCECS